tara:strand:- start:2660 stop:3538 length:879 start_codon:yes stop_codon:yes gene_type:complete
VSKQVKLILALVDSDGKGDGSGAKDGNGDEVDDLGMPDETKIDVTTADRQSSLESDISISSNNESDTTTNTTIPTNTIISPNTNTNTNTNTNKRSTSSSNDNSNLLSISCREEILQLSSLSNEMRALYHDLIGKVVVDLTVNNNVHIKIPLQNVDGIQEARNNLSLRPYQTLLPIADENVLENVLSTLEKRPVSKSQQINQTQKWSSIDEKDVLFRANPTETFGDLCVQLEMNLHELTPLVGSICQSGLGKIISVITSSTIYQGTINISLYALISKLSPYIIDTHHPHCNLP